MSNPIDFAGSTDHFVPPPGLEEMIGWLHVFRNGRSVVSAWIPTAEELAAFNSGAPIYVSVMSGATVLPIFVGTEETCKEVVSDTGHVW